MKKELLTQTVFFIFLFVVITLVKRWFNPLYLLFWGGGILGMVLPIVDHFLYAYVLRPNEIVSERIRSMVRNREYLSVFSYIIATKRERSKLILHTSLFQILFLILAVFVITSSGNLFGRGLVLGFLLHLAVEQTEDFMDKGDIPSWFKDIPFEMGHDKIRVYILANFLLLLFIGIFL